MKKRVFIVLIICFAALQLLADGNTFRKNYSFSMMDFPGKMIQTSTGDYVFAGFNAGGIPMIYGNVTKINAAGNVIWSKKIGGLTIATTINDIIEISPALGGGFIVAGETSPGAIIVRLDNNGDFVWSKKYQYPDHSGAASSEWFNSVIETSDGYFLACGGVSYFWDNVSANRNDSIMPFAVKINPVTGYEEWDQAFVIPVTNSDEHQFFDVTETADGYIFVGSSSQGSGTLDEDGDYFRDGLIVKTNFNGTLIYARKFGDADKSEIIESIITLSTGEVLMAGYSGNYGYLLRINGTGNTPSISFGNKYNNQFQYATLPIPPWGLFASEPILFSDVFEMSDGNYAVIGTYFHNYSLPMSIFATATKINKTDGSIVLAKTFTAEISEIDFSFALLPKGGITNDNSLFLFMQSMTMTGYNYHLTKTDENFSMNNSECPEGTYNPSKTAYSPTLTSITTTSFYRIAQPSEFVNPEFNNLTPTVESLCEHIVCVPPPNPTLDALPTAICEGSAVTLSATGSGADVTYRYYTQASGGVAFATGTETIVYPTLSQITYWVDAESNTMPGCFSSRVSVVITVNDVPDITAVTDIFACNTYTLPTLTTGDYFSSSGGIGPISEGTVISTNSTIYIYAESGTTPNCVAENSFNITINISPNVDDLANQSFCKLYQLPVITGTNLTGNQAYYTETGGAGIVYNAGDIIQFTTFASYPVTLYIYDSNGTCSDEEDFTLTLYLTPEIFDIPDQNQCGSYTLPVIQGINLTGNEAYYTGQNATGSIYYSGQVFNHESFVSYPVTLYIYDANGACTDEDSFELTINLTPVIDAIIDQTHCDSYVLPAITGDNITGNAAYHTLPNGGGTMFLAGASINYSDLTTFPTVIYIYENNGNCSDQESFNLNLYPTPNISDLTNQIICGSYTLPAISGSNLSGNESYYTLSNGAGTMYNAGHTLSFADFGAYPQTIYIFDTNGSCSDEESFELTINENPTIVITDIYCEAGENTYTVEFTNSAGILSASAGTISGSSAINIPITSDITLTINNAGCEASVFAPAPNCACLLVNVPEPENPVNQEICFGETIPALSVDLPVPTEDHIINWYNVALGGIALQTNSTTFTSTMTSPGTYTFYAEAEVIATGCKSDRIPVILTIYANPVISGTIFTCGTGLTSQLIGTGIPNALTPWVSSEPGIATVDINGLVTAVSEGITIITYTNINGCTSEVNFEVIVVPVIAITDVSSLCTLDDEIILETNFAGGIWSGTGIINPIIGTFNPSVAGANTHTITYTYNGVCGSGSDNTEITVIQSANATITQAGPFCITGDPVQIIAAQIGGSWSGTAIDAVSGIFEPQIAGIGDHVITYTISGICGDTDDITLAVLDNFDATITEVAQMCSNDNAINLEAATSGGIWSGDGITDNLIGTFDPSIAGAGTHTITYEYTGACGSSDNVIITVTQSANASITPAGPFCGGSASVEILAAQTGGTWSGTGIDASTGMFDPVVAGIGNHVVSYTITGTCGDSDNITINVLEYTSVSITTIDQEFCNLPNLDTIFLEAEPTGGIWIGNGVNPVTGTFTIEDAGIGVHAIVYSLLTPCSNSDTVYFTVHSLADATITPVDTLYENDESVLIETTNEGGIWSGTGINEFGIFDPEISGIGEFEIIYTIEGLCGDSDTTKIIVLETPIADLRVPTVITPNGDGYNDKWRVQGIEAFDNVSIRIFTRWGDEVFVFDGTGVQYADPINQWDGKHNDKELPSGGYVFILILNNTDTHKGTISLIR